MAKPEFELVIKHKQGGTAVKIGSVWPGKFDGTYTIVPDTTTYKNKEGIERQLPMATYFPDAQDFWFELRPPYDASRQRNQGRPKKIDFDDDFDSDEV